MLFFARLIVELPHDRGGGVFPEAIVELASELGFEEEYLVVILESYLIHLKLLFVCDNPTISELGNKSNRTDVLFFRPRASRNTDRPGQVVSPFVLEDLDPPLALQDEQVIVDQANT